MTEKQKPKKKVKYILGFECIAQKYNPNTGYIFGKIFNLEMNGLYNEFQGSIDFLAEKCGLSYVTAWRIVKLLIKDNLFNDELENVEVNSIEIEEGSFDVINISTTTKTYIANGILTHNKFACPAH